MRRYPTIEWLPLAMQGAPGSVVRMLCEAVDCSFESRDNMIRTLAKLVLARGARSRLSTRPRVRR